MENKDIKISTSTILSYSSFMFWYRFATILFESYLFYFYEVVIKLDLGYITLGFWIYTLLDIMVQPIFGYSTERISRFTEKWGKRFPWIVTGMLFGTISIIVSFMPPISNPGISEINLFLWFLFTIISFDLGMNLAYINVIGLFPDKFRTVKIRRKVQSFAVPISLLALPIGSVLPSLISNDNDPISYRYMALGSGILLVIAFLFSFNGIREDKAVISRYYNFEEKDKESFFKTLKTTFDHRAFVILLISMFGYFLLVRSMQNSVIYLVNFLLGGTNEDVMFYMSALFIGALLSVPIWSKLNKKINDHKKSYVLASIFLLVSTIFLGVAQSPISGIIGVFLFGFGMSPFWILNNILQADVFDERIILRKTDQRGSAIAIINIVDRLSKGVMVTMIAIIHSLTDFDMNPNSDIAKLGLRLQTAFLPAIIFLIGVIIFAFSYPLNAKNIEKIKNSLQEMNMQ